MATQACNLSCKYCYQTKKAKGKMSFATAKQVLENEFFNISKNGNTNQVEIAYLGGEPLLNFDLIRRLSEWIWSIDPPVPIELTVRTNATLLTEHMAQWFSNNRERIIVGISMDGLSSMHKLNRSKLSPNWQFFRENWPSRRISVVLFTETIHLLSETITELNQKSIPFETVIGEGVIWTAEKAAILERELLKLIPYYIDSPKEAIDCGLFSNRISDFFPEYPVRQVKMCGRANNICAYDVDGSPCICHLFSTPVLGHKMARWAWDNLRNLDEVSFDPQCSACPIHKTCRNCFGENLRLQNSIDTSASKFTICNAVKAKARACSTLHLARVEREICKGGSLSPTALRDAESALRLLETIPTFCSE